MYDMLAFALGVQELAIIGLFGVLIFGKKLPEVGRSLGRSFVEFKKGLSGVEDEIKTVKQGLDINTLPPPVMEHNVQKQKVEA